jgi:hypothetical protein
MANFIEDPEETVWIRVPLDGVTAARLQNLADDCHAVPTTIAASLLHDLLRDDCEAHYLLEAEPASNKVN